VAIPLINVDAKKGVMFRGTRWWAERGMVHYEDKDTGEYNAMSCRTCLQRLKGMSDMVGNSKVGDGFHTPQEVDEYQRFVEDMVEIIRDAQEQGEPSNPEAARDLSRRRSQSVIVPDGMSQM
jgi:hypothetical protein